MRSLAAKLLMTAALLSVPMGVQAADRALLIGLDNHGDSRLDFKTGTPSTNDVNGVRTVLTTKLKYLVKDIKVLKNDKATREGILAAFDEWLIKGTAPGDRIYIYFAGHGYFTPDQNGDEPDGLDEGFVPHDAKVSFKDGKLTIDGLVTDDDLTALLSKLVGRDVTIVADTGFSGRVVRGGDGGAFAGRAPFIQQATRAIEVEPKAQAQKAEGGFFDKPPEGIKLAVWSAVSNSQTALLDTSDPNLTGGLFTKLYIEGIAEGRADKNGNGKVSNAELLAYITEGSKKYCASHAAACELGLTPRLEPALSVANAPDPDVKPAAPDVKLTVDTVSDFISKGNTHGIGLKQLPGGELRVGVKNIRYQVTSPHDGFLLLLQVTDNGELVNLFPNQFSRKRNLEGKVRAGGNLMIPGDYYGIRFNATKPSSGQIIAIVSKGKINLTKAAGTRAIEVIPRQEAVTTFLPQIAAALAEPPASPDPKTNTAPLDFSVATLRYVIKP